MIKILFQKKRQIRKNKKKIYKRFEFIEYLLNKIDKKTSIFSSVGYNLENYFKLEKNNYTKGKDFLVVGGMGHTFSIAISYAQKIKIK